MQRRFVSQADLDHITKEDILQAIHALKEYKKSKTLPEGFVDSTTYDVVYEGEKYPPVAVIGLAAERSVGYILLTCYPS